MFVLSAAAPERAGCCTCVRASKPSPPAPLSRCPQVKERRERLRPTLLDLIKRERLGEDVDRSLLRSITHMLTDLGRAPLRPSPAFGRVLTVLLCPTGCRQSVYVEEFESEFLASSAEFYRVRPGPRPRTSGRALPAPVTTSLLVSAAS